MKFKKVKISDILDSPPTNSGLKRKDISQIQVDKTYLPVYSASKNADLIFGWVDIFSKWKKYKNVLTWNKDGSSGIVFYRKDEFVPYEKVKLLRLKESFENNFDYEYLRNVIEIKLLEEGFGFGYKCSMERVLEIEIIIPVTEKDEFDLDKQKLLVSRYSKLDLLRKDIEYQYEEFNKIMIEFKLPANTVELSINKMFKTVKGNAKYTNRYLLDHPGKYPVYSSKTSDNGEIGKIDTYDYDTSCLTWTTDGIYAGTVFLRNNKFNMTTHCGALLLRKNYINKINLEYCYFFLQNYLKDYAVGDGNKRVTVDIIKEVNIKFPVNKRNAPDIFEQKKIAQKSTMLYKAKRGVEFAIEEVLYNKVELK